MMFLESETSRVATRDVCWPQSALWVHLNKHVLRMLILMLFFLLVVCWVHLWSVGQGAVH